MNYGNGDRGAVVGALRELDPQEQREVITEIVKNFFSTDVQRDVVVQATQDLPAEDKKAIVVETAQTLPTQEKRDMLTQTAQDLPDEAQKNAISEATQTLSPEAQKEVVTEAARTLSTEAKKEVVTEAAQALPSEVKRDFVNKAVQTLPTEDKKDVAIRAFQDLPAKDQQQIAGNPSQRVTDQIWLMIVGAFTLVLLASALALLYVAIWPPPGESNPTQVMLPVFTSIAGILAGFISGRASASGTSV